MQKVNKLNISYGFYEGLVVQVTIRIELEKIWCIMIDFQYTW